MGHRAAAGLIFIWILIIAIHVMQNYKDQRAIYWGWITTLILVSCQVFTGMLVVLTNLNFYISYIYLLFI